MIKPILLIEEKLYGGSCKMRFTFNGSICGFPHLLKKTHCNKHKTFSFTFIVSHAAICGCGLVHLAIIKAAAGADSLNSASSLQLLYLLGTL